MARVYTPAWFHMNRLSVTPLVTRGRDGHAIIDILTDLDPNCCNDPDN
ncbi:MAG TPA: hypothetical protein VNU64_20310 [Burkholderiales bacterium]|nr:hypothetical protein [Burkholderiales bacterium]